MFCLKVVTTSFVTQAILALHVKPDVQAQEVEETDPSILGDELLKGIYCFQL